MHGSTNTCSHCSMVLFQMGQHDRNSYRQHKVRQCQTIRSLQPATNPPAVPQHFCTAQKPLARYSSTTSAGEVPKSTEMSAAYAPVPTLPRLHNFTSSLHSTVDGSSSYPRKWQWPFLPPRPYIILRKRKPH